jgi:septum formation protein
VKNPPLILASASPRRRELLAQLNLSFTVEVPQVDEKALDVSHLSPKEAVLKLAQYKGASIAKHHPEAVVIAGDTIVVLNHEVLGKPLDPEDAFTMLSKLQGTEHSVFSAIALFYQDKSCEDALETRVRMKSMTDDEIWRYIATGEPMDKAGAYGIQAYGSILVERIEGCYFNVMGMSLHLLDKLYQEMGLCSLCFATV